jgi:chitinase
MSVFENCIHVQLRGLSSQLTPTTLNGHTVSSGDWYGPNISSGGRNMPWEKNSVHLAALDADPADPLRDDGLHGSASVRRYLAAGGNDGGSSYSFGHLLQQGLLLADGRGRYTVAGKGYVRHWNAKAQVPYLHHAYACGFCRRPADL